MGITEAFGKLLRPGVRGEEAPSGGKEPVSSAKLRDVFSDCCDFEMREIHPGGNRKISAQLVFIDGLTANQTIADCVLRPLGFDRRLGETEDEREIQELMTGGLVYAATARSRQENDEVVTDLLNGYCAVVFDRTGTAVTYEIKDGDKRAVGEPKEEKVVKGAKDAFIEAIKTNTTLVRKKLRNRALKIKKTTVGDRSGTTAELLYIEGFTDTRLVKEVEKRLFGIKAEGVLSAAAIEENLVDDHRTPFPQLLCTERSDKFCLNLLEGRVGILVDGLPMGFLAPGTFSQFFKVPEDSAGHFITASLLTVLRYISLGLTLFLPAFYLAVSMYHPEMLPTKLIQSMIAAKQSVPFPTAAEVVLMLVSFELLQEAGLRLPNPIGETVSIIGALIVGQSAVEAKVVSPVVVVVIALAGIAGYTVPNQDMGAALRICRFLLVIAAILAGMFGIAIGGALLLLHLCSLESFGVSYITPFAESGLRYVLRGFLRYPTKGRDMGEAALRHGRGGKNP